MKKFTTIVIRDMKAPIKGAEPIDAPTRDRIKKWFQNGNLMNLRKMGKN